MKQTIRFFLTGLALGMFLFAFTFLITRHPSRIPPSVQATVGDMTIDQSVGGTATLGTVNFQKIQDSANSAYFLDPAATGDSLVLAGKVTTAGISAGSGTFLPVDSYAGIKVGPDTVGTPPGGTATLLDFSNTTGGAAFSALVIVTGRRGDSGDNVFTDILIFQMENYGGGTGINSQVVVLGSSQYGPATSRSYSTSGYSLLGTFTAGGAGVAGRAVAYLGNGSLY